MLRYFGRLYERYGLPVYPTALCSYPKPYKPADSRHQVQILSRTVFDFQFEMLQSHRLDWRDFLQTSNPAAIALMARMRIAPNERWRVKAASLRLLARARLSGTQRRLISQFVDIYLPLQAVEREAFQAEVASFRPPERETVMELVTSWEREGQIKGRVEGQREVLEIVLSQKLGSVPNELAAQLGELSSSELTALTLALPMLSTSDALRDWLAALPAQLDDAAPEAE